MSMKLVQNLHNILKYTSKLEVLYLSIFICSIFFTSMTANIISVAMLKSWFLNLDFSKITLRWKLLYVCVCYSSTLNLLNSNEIWNIDRSMKSPRFPQNFGKTTWVETQATAIHTIITSVIRSLVHVTLKQTRLEDFFL